LFFRHKDSRQTEFQVDLGDLRNEKERLSSFLQSKLKVAVNQDRNKLTVNSEKLSVQKLQHVVNKFVYRRNLNSTHWVSIEGTTVKINRFKGTDKKKDKPEKHKKDKSPHQTAIQSWGI
jgi:hypothetical protein